MGYEKMYEMMMASLPPGMRKHNLGQIVYGPGYRPMGGQGESAADRAAREAAEQHWGEYGEMYRGEGAWGEFPTPYNQEWIDKAISTRVTGPATTASRKGKQKLQQRLASIGNVSGAPSAMRQMESDRMGAIQRGSSAIELAAQAANFAAQERARGQYGGALLQRSWDAPGGGGMPSWGGMPGMGGGGGPQFPRFEPAPGGAGERGVGNVNPFGGGQPTPEWLKRLIRQMKTFTGGQGADAGGADRGPVFDPEAGGR